MSAKKNLFYKLSLAAIVFGMVVISSVFTGPAFGQDFKRPDGGVPLPMDWSDQHLIYTVGFTRGQASKMQSDPRYFVATRLHGKVLAEESAAIGNPTLLKGPIATLPVVLKTPAAKKKPVLNKDWSVSLGAGGVAQGMSPAKYVFDVNATPSCTADFAVFPVNASTGNRRAHVVGTFSTTTQYSSGTTVSLTVTPTVGTAATLTLTASTSTNSGLYFEVFTSGTVTTNATTEATNLAAAINRNLSTTSSTALVQVVAVASTNTVTVYTLTPGTRVVLTDSETLNNFSWGTVTAGTNGTQANIVGLNELYSGSGTPLCTGLTYPEFTFSYASGTGPVATSPALSLDGTQIAYVENDTNIGAILHVLTIGTGTEHGTCTNSGTATPTCATHAVIPGSTSGSTATDIMLPLSMGTKLLLEPDSYSSPFVDYATNTVYVGDNDGYLYSITNVFGGTPAYAGGNFPVLVHSTYALTSPVVDVGNTGNIFVGDSDGILYNYTSGGTQEATLTVGTTTADGIRDGPVVDSTNEVGYVVAGCSGTESQITQFAFTGTTLTSSRNVLLNAEGCSAGIPMYSPIPDNNYFTKGISSATAGSNGEMIVGYAHSGHSALNQYQFTSGTMGTTAQYDDEFNTTGGLTFSPLTELYSGDVAYTPSAVTTASGTPTTVTVTTPANLFVTGQVVTIAGVTTGTGACTSSVATAIDGEQTITVTNTTHFTFTIPLTTSAAGTCGLSSAKATGPTQDYLFFGTNAPGAYTFTLPLTSATQAVTASNTTTADVAGGTSAIMVDNDSSSGQASSIYFGTVGACGTGIYCAVKLTQSGLL